MNPVPSEDPVVLLLADDPQATNALPEPLAGRAVVSGDIEAGADGTDSEPLSTIDVAVVRDVDGVERAVELGWSGPTVAFVDDPTAPTAMDPAAGAIATTPADLDATVRWLAAQSERKTVRETASQPPSRSERLNAGTTRLASVRTIEEAHRAAIAIAEEVFPSHHSLVGVRDGEWVEPVAASAGVPAEDCNRVRVGAGAAGTVVETGRSAVVTNPDPESRYDTLFTVPIGDDTVIQLVTDDQDGFDEDDRRLAELLASHMEETLGRIRTTEALRTERDHLLALFSNIPDPAIAYDYVDDEPIVHRVNDAFEETFGYPAETVVGESVDDYIVPATDEAAAEANDLNERLQCGENVRREVTRETTSGPRHFILHVVPIRLDAKNVAGYAIYTDVTERRERESTLRRQNERLDEFAAIVSHDLRNPLSVAEGYVTLAIETGDPDHLSKAGEALDRMDELVGDLLSLARQGRAVGETESLSLEVLARDAWRSVDTVDAELTVEDDIMLDANPTRTRELLENVFRNSVEHGSTSNRTKSGDSVEHGSTGSRAEPDDSVEHGRSRDAAKTNADPLAVRVGEASFRGDGGPIGSGFFVEDDGAGLPEDAIDRVFESGFTTDENGTGLGLAITKRIAEAHGWEARAMTGSSGGARFEFRTD